MKKYIFLLLLILSFPFLSDCGMVPPKEPELIGENLIYRVPQNSHVYLPIKSVIGNIGMIRGNAEFHPNCLEMNDWNYGQINKLVGIKNSIFRNRQKYEQFIGWRPEYSNGDVIKRKDKPFGDHIAVFAYWRDDGVINQFKITEVQPYQRFQFMTNRFGDEIDFEVNSNLFQAQNNISGSFIGAYSGPYFGGSEKTINPQTLEMEITDIRFE